MRTGARAHCDDGAGESVVGETVDVERRLLSDAQVGKVRLFRIGLDPRRLIVDHAEHRGAGSNKAAELDVVHLRGGARHRRAHDRMVEIALRVVENGLGLGVFWKLFERQIRIAKQLAQCGVALLHGKLRLQLRRDHCRH